MIGDKIRENIYLAVSQRADIFVHVHDLGCHRPALISVLENREMVFDVPPICRRLAYTARQTCVYVKLRPFDFSKVGSQMAHKVSTILKSRQYNY